MKTFEAVSYPFAQCRDEGHQWTLPRQFNTHGKEDSTVVHFITRRRECKTCEVIKDEHFQINVAAMRVFREGSKYWYPEGYKLPGQPQHEVAEACRFSRMLSVSVVA